MVGIVSKEGDGLIFTVEDVKPRPQKFELVQKGGKIQKDAQDRAKAYSELTDKVVQSVETVAFFGNPQTLKRTNTDLLRSIRPR